MPRHIEAWMDGVALSSVGPILIQQVYEDAPRMEIVTGERLGRYGERLISTTRKSLSVSIEAAIRELHDLGVRARVQERMAAWAMGSELRLSNHPRRRLLVSCSAMPALNAARSYTQTLRIEFTAYAVPYWEDAIPTQTTLSGKSGKGMLMIDGTAQTPVNVTVRPTSGTLTSFAATAGDQHIALDGLSVQTGESLRFERSRWDDLAILLGETSQLSHRSAQSADDLLARPGRADVAFTADTACKVTFSARGRWA